jgi:hypothetical protein
LEYRVFALRWLVIHLSKAPLSCDLFLFEGAQSREIGRNGLREEPLFRGSGYWDLWTAVRESGIGHLETVLSGLRAGVRDLNLLEEDFEFS